MKTFLFLSVLALAGLQGCSKSEDSNQDASGACKQEYLDSWNAVARLTKYSSMSDATTACTNLKNKASVSCKANVMVISGSGQSGDRNISYNDHKAVCDAVLSSTSSAPQSPSNSYSEPAPSSKYSVRSGSACSQGFLDLYNSIITKNASLKSSLAYGDTAKANQLFDELVPLCAEKKIAHAESPTCYSARANSYSYGYESSVSTSMKQFDSLCDLVEKTVQDRQQADLARSVRVLSKIGTFEAVVDSYAGLKKFNSVGGSTYLLGGVWLKESNVKAKLSSSTEDGLACNVTTKAVFLDGTEFKGQAIDLSKVAVVNAETQESVELHKVEFKLLDKSTSGTVVVRCLKKSEVTIDDVESFLGKSITLKVLKAKN